MPKVRNLKVRVKSRRLPTYLSPILFRAPLDQPSLTHPNPKAPYETRPSPDSVRHFMPLRHVNHHHHLETKGARERRDWITASNSTLAVLTERPLAHRTLHGDRGQPLRLRLRLRLRSRLRSLLCSCQPCLSLLFSTLRCVCDFRIPHRRSHIDTRLRTPSLRRPIRLDTRCS